MKNLRNELLPVDLAATASELDCELGGVRGRKRRTRAFSNGPLGLADVGEIASVFERDVPGDGVDRFPSLFSPHDETPR